MTSLSALMPGDVRFMARCPLCRSGGLQPFGAVAPEVPALHTLQSRCESCGLLVSNPQTSEAERDRYYQERYYEQQWPDADRVLRENLATHAAHDIALVQRMSGAHLKAGGRALDVGAGYGATVQTLRQRGFRVTGCELSPRGCTFAHSHGLSMVRAKAPGLPFADGAFDLVTSAHVIEHVGDPQRFVRDLARVLMPGGILALITDHVSASQHVWNRLRARASMRVPPFQTSTDHTFVFGTSHLRGLLERAGCEPLRVVVYHHAPPPESWHWRAYKSTFRVIDRLVGWGPYQLAIGVRVA